MHNIQKVYTTTLEAISGNDDVLAILDAKLLSTSPERVADYMELATSNIAEKIIKLKEYKAELSAIQKDEENRLEYIKEKCAEWLQNEGVEKLEGIHVSSITINDTVAKETLVITEPASIKTKFWKSKIDEAAVKKAIQLGEEVEGAHIEVTHVANKIRVNKKKK